MRYSVQAAILAAVVSTTPAVAQDALSAAGPLRIAAVGPTRVVMVQGVVTDPFVWEWTFLNEEVTEDGKPFDTVAVSVIYDCALRTRRALMSETYLDGQYVSDVPLYEEPVAIPQGTLADGALGVICEPEANADGATFPNMGSARTAMDGRAGLTVRPAAP